MKLLSYIKSLSEHALVALVLAVVFPAILSVNCALASSSPKQLVGGPCTYKQYKGNAEIVSVNPKPGNPATFEIKFSFHPKKAIKEEFARNKDRQWNLVMNDFSDPREDFVKKYGIKSGKRLPCYMKVITKGTCTPVMFDFPTINRDTAE